MALADITKTAAMLSEVGKPYRFLSTLTGPRGGLTRTFMNQQAKRNPLLELGASSMLDQIMRDQNRLDGVFGIASQPTAIQAMIDQHKASSQLLNLGVRSSLLKDLHTAPGTFSELPGIVRLDQGVLHRIAEIAGGERLKIQQDLFQGIANQLTSLALPTGWSSISFAPGFAKALGGYEGGLIARYAAGVIAEAEAAVDATSEADFSDDEGGVWFGVESWSALVWELVTLLKALEFITTGMWAAKGVLKAPIPISVLYLASMAVVAGELAARFAGRTARRLDED